MDLGAWLRSLGLERYEAAFRENAIAGDVLRDLTDQDLEKLGVLLGDRRRLLRAIAALDGAPPPAAAPAPAPPSAKSTPEPAAVPPRAEVSGEPPNVVKLRASLPAQMKADVANEGLALESAIRQVANEATGKSRTEPRIEARKRPPSEPAPAGAARSDRPNAPRAELPGEGWPDALLSARQRLLKGRSAAKGQAATSLRPDVIDEGEDVGTATVKPPQAAPPLDDAYETEADGGTDKAPQAAPPPRDAHETEAFAATAKPLQPARPRRDSTEAEAPAATGKAPQPGRLPRPPHDPEARPATAKAPQPTRLPRDPHEPETRPATAKAPQSARLPRDPHGPEARPATAKAPQPPRLPRDLHEPEARAAIAKAPQPARLPRDAYVPQVRTVPAKVPRPARPPRDSFEPEEPRYPPLIEAGPTSPDLEPEFEQEDFDSTDYGAEHENELERAYELDDEPPVAAPPARRAVRHTAPEAVRRAAPEKKQQRKRSSLSFGGLARLFAVLVILGGLAATISWQWSTVADVYEFVSRSGQQLQSQLSSHDSSAKPQEQASGQAPGATAPGQGATGAASLIEADPNDPNGKHYTGSVTWRTETLPAGPGVAPELAIRADIEIPERRMTMTWSMRRNTDKSLPATHTIEMTFNLPADFSGGSIANVSAIVMKQSEEGRGNKLVTRVAKVTNGYFLIGLSGADADAQRDTQLLKDRPWFDIGIVYASGNYAILALEKGEAGNRAFAQAFAAWEKK